MAQQWRDVEATAASKISTTLYEGEASEPYPVDNCVGLYTLDGYGGRVQEVCAGEEIEDLEEVKSVQVGSGVHINLYTDASFGSDSMCGGQMKRLAYSSPSLEALSEHHSSSSLADRVASAVVYAPTDRVSHFRNEGPYRFYGASADPVCEGSRGNELVLMPDNLDWAATAAVYEEPLSPPFSVSFDLKTSHSSSDPQADGFTFFFNKSPTAFEATSPDRAQQGVVKDGTGYAILFNTWTRRIGTRDGNWEVIGGDIGHPANTEAAWIPVRIDVQTDGVEVYWDDELVYSATHSWDSTHHGVGFTAGTGYYRAEYRLRDIEYGGL